MRSGKTDPRQVRRVGWPRPSPPLGLGAPVRLRGLGGGGEAVAAEGAPAGLGSPRGGGCPGEALLKDPESPWPASGERFGRLLLVVTRRYLSTISSTKLLPHAGPHPRWSSWTSWTLNILLLLVQLLLPSRLMFTITSTTLTTYKLVLMPTSRSTTSTAYL